MLVLNCIPPTFTPSNLIILTVFFAAAQLIRVTIDSDRTQLQLRLNNESIQLLHMSEGTWEKLSQVAVKGAQYDSRERQPHPKCLEGTRVVLLNHIYELLDSQEKSQLIWLHGTAGVGKSAVAFTVAERMRGLKVTEGSKEKRLAGTFFFSRKHTKRRTTGYFFATLAYQLASNFPSVRLDVNRAILENPALLDHDTSLRDQMEALFLRPLRRLQLRLRECPPLTFIIDALDECTPESLESQSLDESTSESELADLISLLGEALCEPDVPITHILLTSRTEEHIRRAMHTEDVRPLVCEIPVRTSGEGVAATISLDGVDVDNDIYIFLQHSFRNLENRQPNFPQPSPNQLARLASRAGRRFIVASTMMKFIDDRNYDPRDRLQLMLELTSELLPGTEVYRLYDSILSTCADPSLAYLHLSVVAALADPLPMSHISELLGPGQGRDVEIVLLQLRSVIDVPTDGSLPVNIYHSSVRDYVSHRSNCSLHQVQHVTSPHSLLALSSLHLMAHKIPESTALLDALSELKRQSQAMEPQDPQNLKHSLAFIVQPPEPLQVLITLLWLRGHRNSELQFWLETLDGHAWLQSQGRQDWLQTQGAQDWVQTQGGKVWLQSHGWRRRLRTFDYSESYLLSPSPPLSSPSNSLSLSPPLASFIALPISPSNSLSPPIFPSNSPSLSPPPASFIAPPISPSTSLSPSPPLLLLIAQPISPSNSLSPSPPPSSLPHLLSPSPSLSSFMVPPISSPNSLSPSPPLSSFITPPISPSNSLSPSPPPGSLLHLLSPSPPLPPFIALSDSLSPSLSPSPPLASFIAPPISLSNSLSLSLPLSLPPTSRSHSLSPSPPLSSFTTPPISPSNSLPPSPLTSSRSHLSSPSPPLPPFIAPLTPLHSSPAWSPPLLPYWQQAWLQTHGGQGWLRTLEGQDWLQTLDGQDWLQTTWGQCWLQARGGEVWLQTLGGQYWLQTLGGQYWLQTPCGREWLQTLDGEYWLQTPGGQKWLRVQGQEWLQTPGGQEWLQTPGGQEWLQILDEREWLWSPAGEGWLQTWDGRMWLQSPGGQEWLRSPGGQEWLRFPGGQRWLYFMSGKSWLQTPGGQEWLQTLAGQRWLQNLAGQDWLQSRGGKDWLQSLAGQDWLQFTGREGWLRTWGGEGWLRTPSGQEWLQILAGQEWLQTLTGQHWLQSRGGKDWLQTLAGQEWLQSPAGQDWLQTLPGKHWLPSTGGKQWLESTGGRDWLQTQGGRDWLRTPHGQAWRLTNVWLTMEEFLSTLEATKEYIISPELPSHPAFQVIQQFKTLPDFLMFPVFLALRHPDHSTSVALQHQVPSDIEIVHAMKAFSGFAYEAWERSRSPSNVLNYACQNWAVHLSRAPNPWDERLTHVFQSFWSRNLISWLERQWCLKDLRSCLAILSEGGKIAQEHL
ncbi:hypothetical protein DFH29DRAFT_52040 [Suillus ampliporus]|nr:hypothetical protein DFH29DRAFT_52040 [Suillus ampliporus]